MDEIEVKKYVCDNCGSLVNDRVGLKIEGKSYKLCVDCYPKGLFCKDCFSRKIKSRLNVHYGKNRLTKRFCKVCKSENVDHVINFKKKEFDFL